MYKPRKIKILSILALVVAITGMTLGFAAFSSVLTISSSATVVPNSDDFKIVIYGIKDVDEFSFKNYTDEDISDSIGYAFSSNATFDLANIDNKTHKISNIKAYFQNDLGMVGYVFLIVNEGKYDAFLDLSDMDVSEENDFLSITTEILKTCIPGEGATEFLVEAACDGVLGVFNLFNFNSRHLIKDSDSDYVLRIPVGGKLMFDFRVWNGEPYADGPFNVEFEDFQLKFSTVGHGE